MTRTNPAPVPSQLLKGKGTVPLFDAALDVEGALGRVQVLQITVFENISCEGSALLLEPTRFSSGSACSFQFLVEAELEGLYLGRELLRHPLDGQIGLLLELCPQLLVLLHEAAIVPAVLLLKGHLGDL